MKIVNNKKKFLVAQLSLEEARKLGWGDICDNCNELMTKERFFIPVLGRRCLCKKCFDEWLAGATRFEEDIPYEEREWDRFLDECIYSGVIIDRHADD